MASAKIAISALHDLLKERKDALGREVQIDELQCLLRQLDGATWTDKNISLLLQGVASDGPGCTKAEDVLRWTFGGAWWSASAIHHLLGKPPPLEDALHFIDAHQAGHIFHESISKGRFEETQMMLKQWPEREQLLRWRTPDCFEMMLLGTAAYRGSLTTINALLETVQDPLPHLMNTSVGSTPLQVARDSRSDNIQLQHALLPHTEKLLPIKWPAMECCEQHPEHLQLGVTAKGFIAVIAEMGFTAENGEICHQAVAWRHEHGLDFADALSPDVVCGYDLQKVIAMQLKRRGFTEYAMSEIMLATSHVGAGRASIFLSHAQQEPLAVTLEAMMQVEIESGRSMHMFVDYPCLRQATRDFDLARVDSAIQSIGRTVMLMTPFFSPQTLTRVFCLFELKCTLRSDVPFEVVIPPGARHKLKAALAADFDAVASGFGHVNVESARARNPEDRELVMGMIRTEFGIQNTNSSIQDAIVRSVVQYCIGITGDWQNPEGYRLLLQLCANKVRALSPEIAMRLISMRNHHGMTLLHKAVCYGASGVFRELLEASGLVPLVKARLSMVEVITLASMEISVSVLELLDLVLADCRKKPNGEQKLEENGNVIVTLPMLEEVLKLCQQITDN